MALTPDEERALGWQVQQKKRLAFQRALQSKLMPSTNEHLKRIEKNFEPLRRDR